ncbi:glycine cleavage system protein GcvH [Candidatus Pantoea multigeneris]|uniref:Glycine cleavage system H protein n=1 Tax=Candidatus Pantoea multigeneris TaxID=2608357 RepID=A0ABX0RCU3_9GAMM|nr:glycine cleavage system protein GcvH [Pantoea multigeneris]NIF23181.1 glycine cleavage system protein GcvH [Pantoea multigeneris]
MSNVPGDLKYTEEHEWVRKEADGTLTVGITDHAQQLLGDVVYLNFETLGKKLQAGDLVCEVESVKAVSDIFLPVSGEILEKNEDMDTDPNLINEEPYGDGWIFKLKPDDAASFDGLMSAEDYKKLVDAAEA